MLGRRGIYLWISTEGDDMNKFTSGEWVVDESRHYGCINRLEPFRHIGMVSTYQAVAGDREENEANARLIAAAPDLLEALIEVAASLEWNAHGICRGINDGPIMPSSMAVEFAKKAIDKALTPQS